MANNYKSNSSEFNPELLLSSFKFPEDPVDPHELQYAYHQNGLQFIKVLPTFASLFSMTSSLHDMNLPGLQVDTRLLLHGQQYIEFHKPLPPTATVHNKFSLAGLHDKGKAAVLEIETKSYDMGSGELLCINRSTIYLRGAGGFSKSSPPFSYSNYPTNQVATVKIPKTKPFTIHEESTQPSQALLYRLSGDYNPLHSDPTIAKIAGFSRPILHGLCSMGFAVKAVIKTMCSGDPNMVKSVFGRFLLHVYPGETLITEMWIEGSRVIYQVKVKERERAVLSGYVDLHHRTSSL
ncbi:hypothetical protein ACFE04_025584 [Oxalis oulophora]